ncbi:MAG: FtsX-like permease family protein [Candidatus Thermoplasmatota archaeon]|jgi:putative ABC transport system permease protein|nr:FtsX-like permease family protein [Candidatus Thermoplasmatota archaeon]
MFMSILGKSFSRRKGKIAIAIIAVIMGAAIPSAMFTVSLDISEKVSYEFRKYGANLILVPKSDTIQVGFPGVEFGAVTEQNMINESDLWKIKTISWRNNVLGFAPSLYQVVKSGEGTNEQRMVLVGTYFNKEVEILKPYSPDDKKIFKTGIKSISPWWEIDGDWIEDPNDNTGSLVGINVAQKLGLKLGNTFTIRYSEVPDDTANETEYVLRVLGIINTDGYEDNQIIVNLQVAQNLTNRPNEVHTVQVSALCNACPVDVFAAEIEEKIPNIDAKTVKQLVSAEMSVLNKVEDMMMLVTVVALLASALGVSTTMTTSVIERQKEIGLMKSIGAENKRIASLFMTEAGLVGLVGGLLGYGIGLLLAQIVGISVFDSTVSPRLSVLPLVLAISIGMTLLASSLPVRRAMKIEPVIVLRGE